ncbi:hypothetical protein Tco_0521522, partial [Tanacetum coccineum]
SFDTSPVLEPEPTVKVRGTRFKTRPNCVIPWDDIYEIDLSSSTPSVPY